MQLPKVEKKKGRIVIRKGPGDRELTLQERIEMLERLLRKAQRPKWGLTPLPPIGRRRVKPEKA